jgi:hypothetical protein
MEDTRQEPEPQEYEAPKAEDVSTEDAPSVTAAGKTLPPGAG